MNFDNPGGYKINPAQRAAIEGWFDTFEDVLYDNGQWLDPVNGYHQYLDAEDFVEYFIFNNLSRNGDGMLISMFPWKGDDGKLRMGPAWDYNWSSYYISGGATGTTWHRRDRLWYGRLFTDPDFEQLYIDRWFYHRDRGMSNAAMAEIIDGQAAEIGLERALRQGYASEAAWVSELNTFKSWLTTRADWYDGQFTARPVFNRAGGEVADGFVVTFAPPPGTIYFTTDGSDPRAPGGGVALGAQEYEGGVLLSNLVSEGDPVNVLVPTLDNPAAGLGWTGAGFDDGAWQSGTTGVGFDRVATYDTHISLNLDATMDRQNTSAYLRIEFEVEDASIYDVLNLKMKYDDGFIAYLNGVEIASDNAPPSPTWNSESTSDHPDNEAVNFVNFPVSDHVGDLVSGTNVLAIHGMNGDIGSSDFLISPELQAGQSTVASGLELSESTLITARTQVGSAWSAPADAYFFIGTEPANADNLVISKIHYRPADASPSELSAGFSDRDDFEFIELANSGLLALDLSGVR
ncbi:MAG: CotH kinase family protein, partial [Verrucomicrobiales bacterium]